MKKILLMLLLCMAIIACGKKEETKQEMAETTNITQEQDYGVPNPYEIVDTLEEASKIAGFDLSVPATYGDYKKQVIQAIEDDMIEVIYFEEESENEGLRIRKAKGTNGRSRAASSIGRTTTPQAAIPTAGWSTTDGFINKSLERLQKVV